ncbi:MAG: CoA transferase subunit A [Dehalococcoidia bacterium]|nr:CoA transferase subunit A [Dehalococcoidia bacterium]
MGKTLTNKLMMASEAVDRFVFAGAVLGMGGQSIGRCPMAISFEIARQARGDLTVVGCNLAMSMDLLVGAGLVRRTECGTGNLERYGTAFRWRAAAEAGSITIGDYSHLAMASRFLAASLGLPFMPIKSLLGSDIIETKRTEGPGREVAVMDNPFSDEVDPVALLPALSPDVSVVHAQRADASGNFSIQGFSTHEPEMIKASKAVIVSCEELVVQEYFRDHPAETTVPYLFVDAVVVEPFGAYPTSVYGHYEHDREHIVEYQRLARAGGEQYQEYLRRAVKETSDFGGFLDWALTDEKRALLISEMERMQ